MGIASLLSSSLEDTASGLATLLGVITTPPPGLLIKAAQMGWELANDTSQRPDCPLEGWVGCVLRGVM